MGAQGLGYFRTMAIGPVLIPTARLVPSFEASPGKVPFAGATDLQQTCFGGLSMNDNKLGPDEESSPPRDTESGFSRRDFLKASGLTAGAAVAGSLTGTALAADFDHDYGPGAPPPGRRVLLKGGVVLSLDPAVGDFEKADVLIEGKTIVAVRPNIQATASVIDCTGMIVMPGFISTHNHQYEAIQRSIIADGLIVFAGDPDQQKTDTTNNVYEAYGTVVQSIWTSGRIGSATSPQWDIGRPPYDPEDNYNAELIACLSQISQGITCGTDTSQASHTPDYTDAMIEALMASGRRTCMTTATAQAGRRKGSRMNIRCRALPGSRANISAPKTN